MLNAKEMLTMYCLQNCSSTDIMILILEVTLIVDLYTYRILHELFFCYELVFN